MPSGNVIRPHLFRLFPKCAEFNFFIAEHVRVRGAPELVFADHSIHDTFFVLFFKIEKKKWDIESDSNLHGITPFFSPTAWEKVWLPNFDKDSGDIITLLFQQG